VAIVADALELVMATYAAQNRGGRAGLVNGLADRRVNKRNGLMIDKVFNFKGHWIKGTERGLFELQKHIADLERTNRKLEWEVAEMGHAAGLARTKSLTKLTDEERKALVLM
jgi:hypothetical protein